MQDLKKYLLDNNFSKQLKKLSGKVKNKTVIIYGTGSMFQTIIKNYDLSNLNIIGITDKKYLPEDKNKFDLGYKIIPYNEFSPLDADYILIAVQEYKPIQEYYKHYKLKNRVLPLVRLNPVNEFIKKINTNFKQIFTPKNNLFVLIKTDGKKVYNPKIKNLEVKFWGKK